MQVDGYFFKSANPTPKNTFLLERARLELAEWVGSFVYLSIAADFAVGTPSPNTSPAVQTKAPVILGGLNLRGWSAYGAVWWWILGDDRIIGEPGMQLPTRLKRFGTTPPRDGVMLAARVDYLDETVSEIPTRRR